MTDFEGNLPKEKQKCSKYGLKDTFLNN